MGRAQDWPGGVEARAIENADTLAWAELLAAAELVDHTGENYDAEDLLEELEDPKVDPPVDSIGLWSGGVMVGYGKVRGSDAVVDGVDRIHTEGVVHPDWRGRGLGAGLVTWLTERAADLHTEQHPGTTGEINTNVTSTNEDARELLTTRSFEPCRYFFTMHRGFGSSPVPPAPVPDGLRLIPFDARYDEALRIAHNEAFADHWGSSPKDPETWKTWFTGSRAFRPELSALVLDGDDIAAYTTGYEYVADTAATGIKEVYIGQVGTRRGYRGRGAARAALAEVLRAAEGLGYQRAALDVDGENPTGALGLYQLLGFETVLQSTTYRLPIR